MYALTNEKRTCDSGRLPESGVNIYDTEKGMSIHVNISEKPAPSLSSAIQTSLLRTCIFIVLKSLTLDSYAYAQLIPVLHAHIKTDDTFV